jgi:hypothetical protein
MLPATLLGVAGILFMLGVISLQLAALKPHSWSASIVIMLVFLGCTVLAGLLAVAALSGVATSI